MELSSNPSFRIRAAEDRSGWIGIGKSRLKSVGQLQRAGGELGDLGARLAETPVLTIGPFHTRAVRLRHVGAEVGAVVTDVQHGARMRLAT